MYTKMHLSLSLSRLLANRSPRDHLSVNAINKPTIRKQTNKLIILRNVLLLLLLLLFLFGQTCKQQVKHNEQKAITNQANDFHFTCFRCCTSRLVCRSLLLLLLLMSTKSLAFLPVLLFLLCVYLCFDRCYSHHTHITHKNTTNTNTFVLFALQNFVQFLFIYLFV